MATDFYSDFHGPVVETDKGKVRGYFEKGVYKFRGIKYANAKRYCSPEEVEPWDGVKDCLEDYMQPVDIIQLKERPFFHFKTNRIGLTQAILADNLSDLY